MEEHVINTKYGTITVSEGYGTVSISIQCNTDDERERFKIRAWHAGSELVGWHPEFNIQQLVSDLRNEAQRKNNSIQPWIREIPKRIIGWKLSDVQLSATCNPVTVRVVEIDGEPQELADNDFQDDRVNVKVVCGIVREAYIG